MPDELPPIIDGSTNANMVGQGSFVVGTTASFFFTFSDVDANLFDPSDISAEIVDMNGSTVETIDAADKLELGIFVLNWEIPTDATAGKYTLNLTYVVETSSGPDSRTFSEDFVVTESNSSGFVTFRTISSRSFLEALIGEALNIPVFHEPARLNRARTVAELTFPRWNQNAGVKVFVNNELKESGFSIDYVRGRITFNNSLSAYDQVLVSYNFRWFTDEELDAFVEQGINMFNIWPPQSMYLLGNIPDRYLIIAIHGAAIFALRRLLFGLIYQQPVKVYGSFERAQQVHSMLMEQKKNYEEWLKMMLEVKKFGPYTGLTKTVTVPEFTLPGGRSRWFRYLFKGS